MRARQTKQRTLSKRLNRHIFNNQFFYHHLHISSLAPEELSSNHPPHSTRHFPSLASSLLLGALAPARRGPWNCPSFDCGSRGSVHFAYQTYQHLMLSLLSSSYLISLSSNGPLTPQVAKASSSPSSPTSPPSFPCAR